MHSLRFACLSSLVLMRSCLAVLLQCFPGVTTQRVQRELHIPPAMIQPESKAHGAAPAVHQDAACPQSRHSLRRVLGAVLDKYLRREKYR